MGHALRSAGILAVALLQIAPAPAAALDRVILGRKLTVEDPGGVEHWRRVVGVGRERSTDVPDVSNPTTGGATLTIVVEGTTTTAQSYVLDAGGWSALGGEGYRYAGPTAADGDPVSKVILQRRPNGTAVVKVTVRGTVGTQPLDVVPPNPGLQGGFVLDVVGGDRYCVAFGGAAGGTVRKDTSRVWKITEAVAEVGCPIPSAVCGNGIIETGESCEESMAGSCPQTGNILCGSPGSPAECQCCVVPGTSTLFLSDPPACCDGSECVVTVPFTCHCPP